MGTLPLTRFAAQIDLSPSGRGVPNLRIGRFDLTSSRFRSKKMAPRGAICFNLWVHVLVVVTMADDNPIMRAMPVAMPAMMPALMPAVMHAAVPHHDGFGAGDRWRRNGDRGECSNDVTKLLHIVLLG